MADERNLVGRTVSHYAVIERLGVGGMGIVYKARDTRLDRFVALKFLPPALTADAAARERFIAEARNASALDHPAVCPVFEVDETPAGDVFIAMAYCPGETLRSRISRGPLAVEEVLDIAIQVADGLIAAHERGIAHLDMKPANVLLDHDGRARIVDFGLANLVGLAPEHRPGLLMGTLPYMSPEQARGEPVDHRSDIWSLGVTIDEMLTGWPPFGSRDQDPVLHAIQYEELPPLATRRPEAPPALVAVVERCLNKDRRLRFRTAVELHDDLRRCRRQLSRAAAVTGRVAPPDGAPRRRGTLAARLRRAVRRLLRWP